MKKFDHDVQDLLVGLAEGGNQLAALQRKFPSIQGTEDHINLHDYFEYLETEGFSTVKDQISSKGAFNEFRLSFITLKKEFITSFRKLEVHLLLGKKYTLIICLLSLFTDYAA